MATKPIDTKQPGILDQSNDAAYDAEYTRQMRRLTNAHSITFGIAAAGLFGMINNGVQLLLASRSEKPEKITQDQRLIMGGVLVVGLGAMWAANALYIKVEQLKDNRLARRIRQGSGAQTSPDVAWQQTIAKKERENAHER